MFAVGGACVRQRQSVMEGFCKRLIIIIPLVLCGGALHEYSRQRARTTLTLKSNNPTVRVGNNIPICMEEFKFRVGGFTRKLPVETADNWFWCRRAIVNKRNRTASAGVHCSVSTQGPPLFKILYPFKKCRFGFRVWVFTKKLPAETANNWFWRKLASHCKQAQQDCSLLVNIAGREILKPTLFK